MRKFVYEVINEAKSKKTRKEKIQVLKDNETWALKDVLKGTLDENIQWLLPTGAAPPYEANDGHNAPTNLLKENKKFRYFVKGGPAQEMHQLKRERIFIELLEGIHPEDALLLIDMINKKPFGGGITSKLVNEAFPGLISNTS